MRKFLNHEIENRYRNTLNFGLNRPKVIVFIAVIVFLGSLTLFPLVGVSFFPAEWISEHIAAPLGIIQNFGWFGVSLFFLISGFVITHVSHRESAKEFFIKRVFRIFPLLALALFFSVALNPDIVKHVGFASVLTNILLINYWIYPQIVLVGVAWTLAIEITFYALMLLAFPLRKDAKQISLVLLAIPAAVIYFARWFGQSFFLFAASSAYIPYLVIGQILYFSLYKRTLPIRYALIYLFFAYIVILYGIRTIHTDFLPVSNSYLINFFYAMGVFILCIHLNDFLKGGYLVRMAADTSYSVYLFHGSIGYFCLDKIVHRTGYPLALFITLLVLMISILAIHFLVERPILNYARYLVK